jgi:LmbE family N-acetylglucosaminyl deacetylase
MFSLHLAPPADSRLRLLCLGAHSDDIEIGCGGTVLKLLERFENVDARWIVFSSNALRAQEACDSANAFLARATEKEVLVKSYRDGFFPFLGDQIKDEFESLKRQFNPDLVFTHYRDDRHQDHRLISDLTWNTFRNHLVLEYEIPKYDGDLGQPNLFVELDESICTRKIQNIINAFASQRQKQWFDDETFRAILRLRGMEANSSTRFAEAFYCRKAIMAPGTAADACHDQPHSGK